jgi:hypothetical protein
MSFTRWNQLRESNSDDARHTPKESIPLNRLAIVIRPPFYPVQKKTLMMKSKAFFFLIVCIPLFQKYRRQQQQFNPKKERKKTKIESSK